MGFSFNRNLREHLGFETFRNRHETEVMGNAQKNKAPKNETLLLTQKETQALEEEFLFSGNDLTKLYNIFQSMVDGDQEQEDVPISKFVTAPQIAFNPIVKRVALYVMEKNNTDKSEGARDMMRFRDFVEVLSVLSSKATSERKLRVLVNMVFGRSDKVASSSCGEFFVSVLTAGEDEACPAPPDSVIEIQRSFETMLTPDSSGSVSRNEFSEVLLENDELMGLMTMDFIAAQDHQRS